MSDTVMMLLYTGSSKACLWRRMNFRLLVHLAARIGLPSVESCSICLMNEVDACSRVLHTVGIVGPCGQSSEQESGCTGTRTSRAADIGLEHGTSRPGVTARNIL